MSHWVVRDDWYRGSALLRPAADALGVQLDKLNYIAAGFACMLIGTWYRRTLHVSRVSPLVRKLFTIAAGLAVLAFCFGGDCVHVLAQTALAYALVRALAPPTADGALETSARACVARLPPATLGVCLLYQSVWHAVRMYYDYEGYTLDITGALMMLTQRLSSLAFSLRDGKLSGADCTPYMLRDAIKTTPDLITYFAYALDFHTVLCGPLIPFREFEAVTNGTTFSQRRAALAAYRRRCQLEQHKDQRVIGGSHSNDSYNNDDEGRSGDVCHAYRHDDPPSNASQDAGTLRKRQPTTSDADSPLDDSGAHKAFNESAIDAEASGSSEKRVVSSSGIGFSSDEEWLAYEQEPDPTPYVVRRAAYCCLSLAVVVGIVPRFPVTSIFTDEFRSHWMPVKLFWFFVYTALTRQQYYVIWKMAEAICNSSGFGYRFEAAHSASHASGNLEFDGRVGGNGNDAQKSHKADGGHRAASTQRARSTECVKNSSAVRSAKAGVGMTSDVREDTTHLPAEVGRDCWDGCTNIDVWAVETALSQRDGLAAWNKSTQRWLRTICYDRLSTNKTLMTFLLSAAWHGFYPGYYLTFMTLAVQTLAARSVRRCVRPHVLRLHEHFRCCKWLADGRSEAFVRRVWDATTFAATLVGFAYATLPFILLGFGKSMSMWAQVYFCGHIFCALAIFALPRLVPPPVPPRPSNAAALPKSAVSDAEAIRRPVAAAAATATTMTMTMTTTGTSMSESVASVQR